MNSEHLTHHRRTEAWLSLALDAARAYAWEWCCGTGDMSWSAKAHQLFGAERGCPATFDGFLERVHPADRDHVEHAMIAATSLGLPCDMECRILGDGQIERWVRAKSAVRTHDQPIKIIGVLADITALHDAERARRALARRLTRAHEQERTRLSRELHDDVSQQLLVACIGCDELRRQLTNGSQGIREKIDILSGQIRDVAITLQRVSHELHPALIRQVGFERALRALCSDIGRTERLSVECDFTNSGPAIDDDVALGLYRITQEALRNALKHSRAVQASVSLAGDGDQIALSIVDNGVGFRPRTRGDGDSLGLLSMRERARLMNGQLNLISSPGAGTRVEVLVPTLPTKMPEWA